MTVVDVVLAIIIAYALIQVIDWVSDVITMWIIRRRINKHNIWRYVDGCYCESDYCECEDECDEVKAEAKVKTKASKGKTFTK